MTDFSKTVFTKSGRPKLGTTIGFDLLDGGTEDVTVVAHLDGRGPEGRQGLIAIIVEFVSDGYRASFNWPLEPLSEEEKQRRLAQIQEEEPSEH